MVSPTSPAVHAWYTVIPRGFLYQPTIHPHTTLHYNSRHTVYKVKLKLELPAIWRDANFLYTHF